MKCLQRVAGILILLVSMIGLSFKALSVERNASTTISPTAPAPTTQPVLIDKSMLVLPMVPSGSYLKHCSYSFAQYTNVSDPPLGFALSIDCTDGYPTDYWTFSMSVDDVVSCFNQGGDISWTNEKELFCDTEQAMNNRLLGNAPIPGGPYLEKCSGVLLDEYQNVLFASCMGDRWPYSVTSLDLDSCEAGFQIVNNNGNLACNPAEKTAAKSGIPLGSYLNACPGWLVNIEHGKLKTVCRHEKITRFENCCKDCDSFDDRVRCNHTYGNTEVAQYGFRHATVDLERCQAQGLNICSSQESRMFCSRFLPDSDLISLNEADHVPSGSYTQRCNKIIYDSEHDILTALCAKHAFDIFDTSYLDKDVTGKIKLADAGICIFDNPATVKFCDKIDYDDEIEYGETLEEHLRSSVLMQASLCVDRNNISQIDIDKEGRLYCSFDSSPSYIFNRTCGAPFTPPCSGEKGLIIFTAVTSSVLLVLTAVHLAYSVYGSRGNRGSSSSRDGYQSMD